MKVVSHAWQRTLLCSCPQKRSVTGLSLRRAYSTHARPAFSASASPCGGRPSERDSERDTVGDNREGDTVKDTVRDTLGETQ